VGPKLAERIVVELKGKPLGAGLASGGSINTFTEAAAPVVSVSGDAVAALMGLGIAEPAARRAVDHVSATEGPEVDLSTLIKLSLRELGK
jgi:Holliday junction DNA helicase RuvA